MRVATLALALLLMSACTAPRNDEGPEGSEAPSSIPVSLPLYLKARYGLSTAPPMKETSDSITATPFQNAFVNEDLRSFATNETHPHLNITSAKLTIFYNVDTPLVAPVGADPESQDANRVVFWIGSRSNYVANTGIVADALLMPGTTYKSEIEFALPEPGWIVPRNEPIMLLFANLVPGANPPAPASAASSNLHFLVDGNATPSVLELAGSTVDLSIPSTLSETGTSYSIAGNTGLFTGATPEQVPSRLDVDVDVASNTSYLEVRVNLQSTSAGKSDLDFEFYAPDGSLAASSTTPYQSEVVRLFGPHLAHFGSGTYRAEITAYSGADNRLELRVLTNEPR